jgi:Na+/H+ antiporter NhaB
MNFTSANVGTSSSSSQFSGQSTNLVQTGQYLLYEVIVALSIAFAASCAILSAFLDALTVVAVIIKVGLGFYSIYHKVVSGREFHVCHQ